MGSRVVPPHRLTRGAIGVAVMSITATVACSPPAPAPEPAPPTTSRCAVAWTGYLASMVGDVVGIELLVLDLDASGLPPPVFEQARLEGGEDTVEVTVVETLDVEMARNQEQPYIVSLTLDDMAVGVHEYTRLTYVDEGGVDRSLDIGIWRFEVIPRAEHVIEQTVIQMGGMVFRKFGAELLNTAAQPVEITALVLALPNTSLTSTMGLDQAPDGSGPLTSAAPGPPMAEIAIPAGERRFITFDITIEEGTVPPFVAIQPMIEHRIDGEPAAHRLPLGYTRYTPRWDAEGYADYCDTRPPGARHGIG